MYEAHLADPVHGEATKQAETPEAAVEAAFRELAQEWMEPGEEIPNFDGEIRNKIEVWWHNHEWALLGTVQQIHRNWCFIFIISEAHAKKETAHLIHTTTFEEACKILHKHLKQEAPEYWSDKWRDLLTDVQEGNQTAYGPIKCTIHPAV